MKRLLARCGLVVLGVVLALALLEGALRLLSTFVGDLRGGARGTTTILCVGDSHTYGLHVLPPDAYPSVLQRELDPAAHEVGVLNYGVPGRNAGALARELPRYLRETRPDIVLVKVGYNDSWNHDARDGTEAGADHEPPPVDLRVLRLWRLLRLQMEGRSEAPPDLIERDGAMFVVEDGRTVPAALGGEAFGTLKGEALATQVSAHLHRIVAQVRAADAGPVLLTYATENQPVFRTLNEAVRRVAAAEEVPLVALDEALRGPVAEFGYRPLFFPDDHPTARGNEIVGRAVADRLAELGLVRRTGAAASSVRATPTRLTLVREDDDALEFSLEGAPHRDFQIVLSPIDGPPVEVHGVRVPLGAHPLVAHSLEAPDLRGRTDAAGRSRCRLSRAFLNDPPGTVLYAVAAVFPRVVGSTSPPDVSNVVSFRP